MDQNEMAMELESSFPNVTM